MHNYDSKEMKFRVECHLVITVIGVKAPYVCIVPVYLTVEVTLCLVVVCEQESHTVLWPRRSDCAQRFPTIPPVHLLPTYYLPPEYRNFK